MIPTGRGCGGGRVAVGARVPPGGRDALRRVGAAQVSATPLLFKGDDFRHTGVSAVL